MRGEAKMLKSVKSAARRHMNCAFVLGFFFVLLTYLAVSQQFALRASNVVTVSPPAAADGKKSSAESSSSSSSVPMPVKEQVVVPSPQFDSGRNRENQHTQGSDHSATAGGVPAMYGGNLDEAKPICDVGIPFAADICDASGDVRVNGLSAVVLVVPPQPRQLGGEEAQEWKIKPYSRKSITSFREFTVKQLSSPQEAPPCTAKRNIPAVVFALGGLIGNYWHDFTDLLVPLFLATRQFNGEVQLLATNIQPWWLGKYTYIMKKLSNYEIIDLDNDAEVRCFSRVLVGLRMHKEFSIDPARAPNGLSMVDFTKFLRETYSLPRDAPIKLSESPGQKPKMLIIHRTNYRRFTNTPEIAGLGERLGFEVLVVEPTFDSNGDFARTINSFDVMLGMHGAGLTNAVFLPTNAVMIQVVPYGNIEHLARTDFGDPAVDMKLQYLEYSVSAEESTLMEMFGKDHPAIKDPVSIHKSGWDKVAEYYLGKQDVRINLERFTPILLKAQELLR